MTPRKPVGRPRKAASPTHPTISDVALALASRRSEPVSKVGMSLNAKGDVQYDVDVSHADPTVAAALCEAIFADLRAKYPRAT
jgi:hypothetical protein